MRAITNLILAIFSISLIAATTKIVHSALAQIPPANLLTYQNSTLGIKVQYPSNWDKQENGTKQDTLTDAVTFSAPGNSNASKDIAIDDISDAKGTTLAQYASDQIGSLKQQYASNDFKLLESKNNLVLAGLPAYDLTYTSVDQNAILKDREIGTIKADKVYILTYEAGVNEYAKYLPIAQKMIDSLNILK